MMPRMTWRQRLRLAWQALRGHVYPMTYQSAAWGGERLEIETRDHVMMEPKR